MTAQPSEELTPAQLTLARRQIAQSEKEHRAEAGQDLLVLLSRMRRSEAVRDVAVALEQLVDAVREHGKSGHVTLKLTVAPMKGADLVLTISDTVVSKPPTGARPVQIVWAKPSGGLSIDQPDQITLIDCDQLGD